MKLLIKVKNKISNIEYGVMNGNAVLPPDESLKCNKCKENDIDCLLYPCEHLSLCCDCVKFSTKCPICFKFIDYYDIRWYVLWAPYCKRSLPNNPNITKFIKFLNK